MGTRAGLLADVGIMTDADSASHMLRDIEVLMEKQRPVDEVSCLRNALSQKDLELKAAKQEIARLRHALEHRNEKPWMTGSPEETAHTEDSGKPDAEAQFGWPQTLADRLQSNHDESPKSRSASYDRILGHSSKVKQVESDADVLSLSFRPSTFSDRELQQLDMCRDELVAASSPDMSM